ncbi:MAG: hypothetical protein HY782_11240 [Chloroflexi bacterium]|nr:hypothetical protein [Chloroflexota bacterium]
MSTSKSHRFPLLVLFLAVVAFILLAPVRIPPATAQGPQVQGPFVGPPIIPVSSVRAGLGRAQARPPEQLDLLPPQRRAQAFAPALSLTDPVRQSRKAITLMPAPIQNFEGLSRIAWGAGWPPDPNGDVGPNHYVQAVNISLGIFSKTGSLLYANTFNGLFDGTGTPCDTTNRGDPIVLYDQLANRWIVTDFAFASSAGPFYQCIAVSKTGDPVSGGWWFYAMVADSQLLNDYPKLGLWPDAYYMSANMFRLSTNSLVSTRVWALDRNAMLNGLPLTPVSFDLPCGATCYPSLLPSNLRGALPPSGSPNFFASIDSPNILHLWKFHVDWTSPGNSTFTGPTNLTVANFAMPCNAAAIFACVPQPGVSPFDWVDGLGDRLMMQLQYRNIAGTESLWANHTVATSTAVGVPTGIRWYEIRDPNGSPSIYQQGTFQPDANYRWMGSLAVDRVGNMALGYSVSSTSLYPSIRYTGRLASDPLGILGQGETSLVEGTGSQVGHSSRWGDYSAMTVDPVDDCTFWYTNEYYATTGGNWQTRIGSFVFPSCLPPPAPPATVAPTPRPQRCDDAYEPDDSADLAHTITTPQWHNFCVPTDQDWVKFKARAGWVYHIKADTPTNFPTEPRIELYVNGNLIAANDHYFGNIAEIWWWNNIGDVTGYVRVTELKGRAEGGNSQYTLSLEEFKDKP